jgi:hypothetical protein
MQSILQPRRELAGIVKREEQKATPGFTGH